MIQNLLSTKAKINAADWWYVRLGCCLYILVFCFFFSFATDFFELNLHKNQYIKDVYEIIIFVFIVLFI